MNVQANIHTIWQAWRSDKMWTHSHLYTDDRIAKRRRWVHIVFCCIADVLGWKWGCSTNAALCYIVLYGIYGCYVMRLNHTSLVGLYQARTTLWGPKDTIWRTSWYSSYKHQYIYIVHSRCSHTLRLHTWQPYAMYFKFSTFACDRTVFYVRLPNGHFMTVDFSGSEL